VELLTLLALAALVWFLVRRRRATRAARPLSATDAALRARADYEHRLFLSGDVRGVYGQFPPAAKVMEP
jgi:hypothetical protein